MSNHANNSSPRQKLWRKYFTLYGALSSMVGRIEYMLVHENSILSASDKEELIKVKDAITRIYLNVRARWESE